MRGCTGQWPFLLATTNETLPLPHVFISPSSKIWYQPMDQPCGWIGNRRSGVTLATCHRHQWFSTSQPTGWRPRRGRWEPPYALLVEYGDLYFYSHKGLKLNTTKSRRNEDSVFLKSQLVSVNYTVIIKTKQHKNKDAAELSSQNNIPHTAWTSSLLAYLIRPKYRNHHNRQQHTIHD